MSSDSKGTIADHLEACGVRRRDFLRLCSVLMATAPAMALTQNKTVAAVAQAIGAARRPSVIWLHFQDCTGCSETLLRTSKPDVADLILNVISLDYHETLMAASGHQAEAALEQAMRENAGKYVLVCEGSIPTAENGVYLTLGGRTGVETLERVAANAAAVIGMGSCASWGGVPSADPNPTGAVGVDSIIKNKPVVNIPGCPPNPYNLLAVVLEYATQGTLPAMDEFKRPKFAYDRVIHDHCPRRGHFDAGRFATTFGDEGHRQGWCLYKLGCKGPVTHAACATRHFNEVPDVWPIGIGAPCVGCTEKSVGFRLPIFQQADILNATPAAGWPSVHTQAGKVSAVAAGIVGTIAGAVGGAAYVSSQRFQSSKEHTAAADQAALDQENKGAAGGQ